MPENWEIEDDFWVQQRHKESDEFTKLMLNFWERHLNHIFTKKRDIQISDAILELFRRADGIDNFNKKALYVYIREMTDCKTQYITKVIKTMREINNDMLSEYRSHGYINSIVEAYENIFWV